MGKPGRKEARRQARLARRAAEAQQVERRRRRRVLGYGGIAAVAMLVAAWALWASLRPEPAAVATAVGEGSRAPASPSPQIITVADQGRDHVLPGAPHPPYNSNPPTSGWHYAATATWGFHNTELPDELVVHNLEHGGIWISYKDTEDTEVVDGLVALAREYRTKVIVTHRPRNDSRIAVAAWGRLMKLDRFDRTAIVDFINRFKNKGPEFVPD